MTSTKEVDALSGTETTGHEWDDIRELNTPLPKWWLYVFYATIVWGLAYSIAYPAWPWLSGYTKGVLGYSSRAELMETLDDVKASRAVWVDRFAAASVEDIAKDPTLLQFAMAGGRVLFADNCAPCHGTGGAGAKSFPALGDDDWIWGGTLDAIHTTLLYGIRSGLPEARISQMPAFGADEILTAEEISNVAEHVLSLSGAGPANAKGAAIFAEQCVACHGEDGKGIQDVGGPNLTDKIWLYGSTKSAIVAQIVKPRQGVMPAWQGRLSDYEIKQLAVYVHSLGGGE
jgi:cytochrome c oxidase cbb3-type subunit 3